jgi:hypothetical protein
VTSRSTIGPIEFIGDKNDIALSSRPGFRHREGEAPNQNHARTLLTHGAIVPPESELKTPVSQQPTHQDNYQNQAEDTPEPASTIPALVPANSPSKEQDQDDN